LRQSAFHYAAKRILFCGKMHAIMRQNAFYFAAKCTPLCGKTHSIMPQNGTVICGKNAAHFAAK